MKTLNDKIIITATIEPYAEDRYLAYTIVETKDLMTPIFKGQLFAPKSSVSQDIDICINDIIQSQVKVSPVMEHYDETNYAPIRQYALTINDTTYTTDYIYLGYENKLFNFGMQHMLSEPACSKLQTNKQFSQLLQGILHYSPRNARIPDQTYTLYPRYPYIATQKLNFAQLFNVGAAYDDINIGFMSDTDELPSISSTFTHNNFVDNFNENLEDFIDVIPYKKNIVVTSDQFTKGKITGEKLYLVTVNGQSLYEDESIHDFIKSLGYSDNFYWNFFAINPNDLDDNTYYMAYYTNEPNEIDEKWEQYYGGGMATMTYERKERLSNWVLELYFKDSSWSLQQYQIFVNRFSNNYQVSEQYINEVWGITKDNIDHLPEFIRLKMPDFIPNGDQWLPFTEDLFENFNVYANLFEPYDPNDVIHIQGDDIYETYREYTVEIPIKIAEFDECPAKFYLQWFDRFGGIQCQPFDGKNINDIDYSITNITNRYGEKRPIALSNTYQFDLNTKWLSEDEYKLFESIFISPKLKLYNTEKDASYDVIVVDKKFTEKTFKNQGKMFNFEIKVAINNTENIIY